MSPIQWLYKTFIEREYSQIQRRLTRIYYLRLFAFDLRTSAFNMFFKHCHVII